MNPWPPSWPDRVLEPFPVDPPKAGRYKPIPGTTPFWCIYSKVTGKIRDFAQKSNDADVRDFLEFLIGGFYAEYKNWNKLDAASSYFRLFQRTRFRSLSLVAHAYFHMGYDLPRTTADSFVASPSLGILSLNKNKASITFLRLNPVFPEVFAEEARNYSANGIFAILARVLPLPIIKIPSHWVKEMRLQAFINARILAEDLGSRQKNEQEILHCVVMAGEELARHKWNPALWLELLPAPAISSLCLLFFQLTDVAQASLVAKVLVGIVTLAIAYLILAYRGIATAADDLGMRITRNLEARMSAEDRGQLENLRAQLRRVEDSGSAESLR